MAVHKDEPTIERPDPPKPMVQRVKPSSTSVPRPKGKPRE